MSKKSSKRPETNGHLLFFDTRFARLLLENPRSDFRREWQNFFIEKIFAEYLPQVILTTPFSFLEFMGIRLEKRALEKFPSLQGDERLSIEESARELPGRFDQMAEEGLRFYSTVPELKNSHFNERRKRVLQDIAPFPYQQMIAGDIMSLPFRIPDFEKALWTALALDDMQAVLLRPGESNLLELARLQALKDMLALYGEGFNYSIFRLMRSIYVSEEVGMLKPKVSTAVPLRKVDDLADTDYVHYATFGGYHKGKQRTVTAFTCDPYEKVETRLKVAKQVYQTLGLKTLRKSLAKLPGGVPIPRSGRVVVCDPDALTCRVIKVADLDTEIKYSDDDIRPDFLARAELLKLKMDGLPKAANS